MHAPPPPPPHTQTILVSGAGMFGMQLTDPSKSGQYYGQTTFVGAPPTTIYIINTASNPPVVQSHQVQDVLYGAATFDLSTNVLRVSWVRGALCWVAAPGQPHCTNKAQSVACLLVCRPRANTAQP